QIFSLHDLPVANNMALGLKYSKSFAHIEEEINANFEVPFVIMPNSEGSTLGLTIVDDTKQIFEALKNAKKSNNKDIAEQLKDGIQLTVPVKSKKGNEMALNIIEIIHKNDLYDYEAKYTEGGSEHIIPARLSDEMTQKVKEYAVKAHQSLGCETYSRAD